MKAGRRATVKSAIELTEEAVHLLRQKPVVLLEYYVGALPFVLGGLCFWMDMARSPLAYEHLAGGSLGMGALFLWMKFWQAIFAGDARALLAGAPTPPPCWARGRRRFCGPVRL